MSKQEWLERYATPGAEAEFYARLRGGRSSSLAPVSPLLPQRQSHRRRSSRRRTCNSMMDRREALLLVERLKRRTRDPEVLTLCEYVHGADVHGTIPGFRRPGPGTQPAVIPVCLMPGVRGTSGGRDGKEEKMAPWAASPFPRRASQPD